MMVRILKTIKVSRCKLSLEQVLVSFCMVFPLVFRYFLLEVLPDDFTLNVMRFQS